MIAETGLVLTGDRVFSFPVFVLELAAAVLMPRFCVTGLFLPVAARLVVDGGLAADVEGFVWVVLVGMVSQFHINKINSICN